MSTSTQPSVESTREMERVWWSGSQGAGQEVSVLARESVSVLARESVGVLARESVSMLTKGVMCGPGHWQRTLDLQQA